MIKHLTIICKCISLFIERWKSFYTSSLEW